MVCIISGCLFVLWLGLYGFFEGVFHHGKGWERFGGGDSGYDEYYEKVPENVFKRRHYVYGVMLIGMALLGISATVVEWIKKGRTDSASINDLDLKTDG